METADRNDTKESMMVIPDVPALSFPTFLIGNLIGNPVRGINDKEEDPGFPLTTGGNDGCLGLFVRVKAISAIGLTDFFFCVGEFVG